MSDAVAEFEKLKAMHESATLLKEGGNPVALLSDFAFLAGGKDHKMSLLLFPAPHSGYPTRLFFERKIDGKGNNWTEHRILDRQWWAPSWRGVAATLPWTAMLCEHLRAVA